MTAHTYTCCLSPRSLDALERAARAQWTHVELGEPVQRFDGLRIRTHRVRIRGETDLVIGAATSDVIPNLEVFKLSVRRSDEDQLDVRIRPTQYRDSGELLSAFLGAAHQVIVATRRHAVPEWAGHTVAGLLVDDLLILRHLSGQHAFVAPDDEQPGSLLVTRAREHVPFRDAEITSLRII